jgi:hypothetical protein
MITALLFITLFLAGFLLSAWLYGAPWSQQRLVAPRWRLRLVYTVAWLVTVTTVAMFLGRDHVVRALPPVIALRLFVVLIFAIATTFYATLPPQRAL